MLRLVQPPGRAQGTDPPTRCRRQRLDLTLEEKKHLRAALLNLRRNFGTWATLAAAMGVEKKSLTLASQSRNPRGFPGLALHVARIAKLPVESILTGAIAPADKCPACGSTVNARLDRTGGAS